MTIRIELARTMFGELEKPLCSMGEFTVSTFLYASGVAAVRAKNARGEIILLPFKGQQIWRAAFDGRDLTMKSMFDEPVNTTTYLETYGAFFIHCGLTGMGAPGPTDKHPLHGEIPNAPFQKAWIELDEHNGTLALKGSYHYASAFWVNYLATAKTVMMAGSALIDVSLTVDNLKQSPMDLMYLAHANFRPVDNGELVYSAPYTAEAVRVRQTIPSHVTPKAGYAEFLAELVVHPERHHVLTPGLGFDPEVVFSIDMQTTADGFAHALQRRPDGTADYMRYQPAEARHCIRWICRTPEQDAIGMAFPSTSEVEGYTAEKAKGNVVSLGGGQTWAITMRLGALTATETEAVTQQIKSIAYS